MRIPSDAIVPIEKLFQYLLVLKQQDDKSKFLAQAGFTLGNWEALLSEIRSLAKSAEAIEDRTNEYGTFYRVDGELRGVNGVNLAVRTIWLQRELDKQFQFITLKPRKESKRDA
jgi:hypothetical protein